MLHVVSLLGEMRRQAQPAAPWIRQLMNHRGLLLQITAARVLWQINGETNGISQTYVEALQKSRYSYIRVLAADYLAEFCADQRVTVPEFEAAIQSASQDSYVRFYAARTLWEVNGRTNDIVPILTSGLKDHYTYYHNNEIRQLAAETLGEMRSGARSAVPDLVTALPDPQPAVRAAVTNALKQIDPEAAAKFGVK